VDLKKEKIFKVRKANIKDAKFTFNLFNENVSNKKFFTKKKINFNDHLKWYENRIKKKFFYICYAKERIGFLRLENISKKDLSVSIAIGRKYQNKNYGKNFFEEILDKKIIKKYNIWAFIKSKNLASNKFFKTLGFKKRKENKYRKEKYLKIFCKAKSER